MTAKISDDPTEAICLIAQSLKDRFAFERPIAAAPIPMPTLLFDSASATNESDMFDSSSNISLNALQRDAFIESNAHERTTDEHGLNKRRLKEYIECYHSPDIYQAIMNASNLQTQNGALRQQFMVVLRYDPCFLLDWDHLAGNQLMKTISENVHDLILCVCHELIQVKLGSEILMETVRVNLHPMYHPAALCYASPELIRASFTLDGCDSMIQISGIIVSISRKQYAIYSQLYHCINSDCHSPNTLTAMNTSYGVRVVKRSSTQKLLEVVCKTLVRPVDMHCSHCETQMVESIPDRVFSCEQKAEIVLENQPGCFSSTIKTVLRDSLNCNVDVGDHIDAIVTVIQKYNFLTAKGSPKLDQVVEVHQIRVLFDAGCPQIESFERYPRLHTYLDGANPFDVSQKLVTVFASAIVPSQMWRKMRLSFLLSLVSIGPNQRNLARELESHHDQITILIVCDSHCPAVLRAIYESAKYRRFAEKSADEQTQVLAVQDKDRLVANPWNIAKDGVLFAQFDQLRKKQKMELIEWSSHEKGGSNNIGGYDPNCAVWILTESDPRVREPDLSHIDIILNLQSCDNPEVDECISTHILGNEVGPAFVADEMEAEMIHLIRDASNLIVTISDEAQLFLSMYVCVLRSAHGACVQHSLNGMIKRLIRLTKAHSKLCNRKCAMLEDGLIAIMLVEESIAFYHGVSLLGFQSLSQDLESLRYMFQECDDVTDALVQMYEKLVGIFEIYKGNQTQNSFKSQFRT